MTRNAFRTLSLGLAVAVGAAAFALAGQAQAQSKEIRISYQFGLGFLPVTVALENGLIEKHAKALGVDGVKVTGVQLSGAAITNDALLSGNIELAAGGVGGVLQLWDRTDGGVKGLVALNDMALILNTVDPAIETLTDYVGRTDHRIALPAVRVGLHAIVLQMAAEQALGEGKHYDLDNLTVSLPHPDAHAALMTGRTEVRSHFTSMPFSYLQQQQSQTPVRQVLSSYDVLGGPHNNTMLYAREQWVSRNPELARAVFNAFVEAHEWINGDPARAAELFKTATKSSLEVADLEAMIRDPSLMGYRPEPRATMKFADFFLKIGRIKKTPESWKDYFWDVAHDLPGS